MVMSRGHGTGVLQTTVEGSSTHGHFAHHTYPGRVGARPRGSTNRDMTSVTPEELAATSSKPILGPWPAMSLDTEILGVYDLHLGYDAQNSPDTQNGRAERVIRAPWWSVR